MFTGIVQGKGRVRSVQRNGGNARILVDLGRSARGVEPGDSIAINGVCLSVVAKSGNAVGFDAIAETLRKTNLGTLAGGSLVNYETSMAPADLIGGHLVTGHIDGTGTVREVTDEDGSTKMVVAVPRPIGSMVMEKGLVAVDGISLTPADVADDRFTLYLIPDTLRKTTIAGRKPGDLLNIELDLFGKYIEKFVRKHLERARVRRGR